MTKVDEKFYFVPPRLYQRNADKRAIQKSNNHFIAEIFIFNKDLPMYILCRLTLQACLVLNLLQQ